MKKLVSLLALTSIAAAPVSASVRDAAFAASTDRAAVRSSLFVGATYRVGLDRRTSEPKGRASLKIAGMSKAPEASELKFSQGLELTGGKTGKPTVYVAGRDLGQLKTRAGLNGTTTAIIVGGVLVLGIVAALVISDYQRDQRCIGEDGDCD